MEGPSARALAVRPVEVDGGMKRGRQMRLRLYTGAVNKPAVQRRRGIARFTPVVEAAPGDAVSGVGPTVPAEVAAHNPVITPPTRVLPADVSSGADELLNDFAFDLENVNADFDWSNADFVGLESDLIFDWGLAADLTGV